MKYFFAVVVTAVILIVFASLYTTPHIILSRVSDNEILLIYPVQDGVVFSIKYIHSVNQSPVEETFEIHCGKIILQVLEFEDFGAGMPTELEYGQNLIHLPSGRMRIEGFNREVNNLRYMVGHVAEFVFYIEDKRVLLSDLAEPGAVIEISHRNLNFWRKRGVSR